MASGKGYWKLTINKKLSITVPTELLTLSHLLITIIKFLLTALQAKINVLAKHSTLRMCESFSTLL